MKPVSPGSDRMLCCVTGGAVGRDEGFSIGAIVGIVVGQCLYIRSSIMGGDHYNIRQNIIKNQTTSGIDCDSVETKRWI